MSAKALGQTTFPAEVTLKFTSGKEVSGQYSDQVLNTLTGGRVMYICG
jgi:hypothetical protein